MSIKTDIANLNRHVERSPLPTAAETWRPCDWLPLVVEMHFEDDQALRATILERWQPLFDADEIEPAAYLDCLTLDQRGLLARTLNLAWWPAVPVNLQRETNRHVTVEEQIASMEERLKKYFVLTVCKHVVNASSSIDVGRIGPPQTTQKAP